MLYQFIPYVIILGFSAGITFFLCILGFYKIKVSGHIVFSMWMFVCSYWSVCNAFELMGTTLPVKLFWANMQYVSYSFFPVLLFILICILSGYLNKNHFATFVFLFIIPVITSVLVWFDTSLGIVRYGFSLVSSGNFVCIKKTYGSWFFVHAAYTYGLFITSLFLLVRSIILQKNELFKKQQFILLTGIVVVFIPNILYVLGLSPIKKFDITPVFFSVTGTLVLFSMVKFRFLGLVPIARESVFENMGEGIVVTDNSGNILDINSRARTMFRLNGVSVIGKQVKDMIPVIFASSPEEQIMSEDGASSVYSDSEPAVIYSADEAGHPVPYRYFERRRTPLTDKRGKNVGWIYNTSDITDLHLAQKKVWQQQQELAVSQEQQRVARDLHDNIGQILSFAGIQIQTIQHELEKGNSQLASQYLSKLKNVTDQSYKQLRQYIFNLRQPNMQNISFRKLLTDFTSRIESTFPLLCVLELSDEIPALFDSPEIKSHLFSLTREAVNNCIKHSGASKITIGIQKENSGKIIYFIEDNGKGIVSDDVMLKSKHSSGIRIMEERALLMGGRFNIASGEGKGTRITVIYDGDKL
jgi:PAS domain S-box-containing protein